MNTSGRAGDETLGNYKIGTSTYTKVKASERVLLVKCDLQLTS